MISTFGLYLIAGFTFKVRFKKKGWLATTFTIEGATKSQGLFEKSSLERSFISKGKLMLEQFLKGIGGTFFLMGIFMISFPLLIYIKSFKHIMWGTSHFELIDTLWGFIVSTWILIDPPIYIDY